jgi:hypothetical protein
MGLEMVKRSLGKDVEVCLEDVEGEVKWQD